MLFHLSFISLSLLIPSCAKCFIQAFPLMVVECIRYIFLSTIMLLDKSFLARGGEPGAMRSIP